MLSKRDPASFISAHIHSTSIVHPRAELGSGVEIGPYCVVGENVRIGDGTRLLANVMLNGHTIIGKQCEIHPFTVIGATSQDKKYRGEVSHVRLGDRNIIREFVTIHRGTGEGSDTIIGNDNLLLAYVHIAHNCRIGDHVVMSNSSQLAGHVSVDDYAGIGGMVGVHQFVRIGRMSFVGGGTKLLKDVPPYFMVAGSPGSVRGLNTEGLKRRGITREAINELKEAYRLLYRSEDRRSSAITQLRARLTTPEGRELVDFFMRPSDRGIVSRKATARRGASNGRAESVVDDLDET
ncbi:MAG TPA: acyl-ACP--UDP-N-acetylglucosamine O-acyltransferase [Candidatus Eremiobacteraceae bacterium]|nr:acyl-ACP--UDP-N-acetylglucosamine O-acyltransferase [Candidatus Eremiobacteraceae bacterium]